eukprot:2222514-Pyramimonas_sp.AAC.1
MTWFRPTSPRSIGTITDGCALPVMPMLIVGAAPSPYDPAVFVVYVAFPVCSKRLNSLAASEPALSASFPLLPPNEPTRPSMRRNL